MLKFDRYQLKIYNFFHFFGITGPSLPYSLSQSAMTKFPNGRGVILFGGVEWIGVGWSGVAEKRILELHAGVNSWSILDITLENGRHQHVVIPL